MVTTTVEDVVDLEDPTFDEELASFEQQQDEEQALAR